jgi:hypothetical protein
MLPLPTHNHVPDECGVGARLSPPPPAAIGRGAGPATLRLRPVVGDNLLDPFEARNADLNLRLAVRVEAEAVALAPMLLAEDLFLWMGTGEPAATAPGGGCPVGVGFLGYRLTGDGVSASEPTVNGSVRWMVVSQAWPGQNFSGLLNLSVFQTARPGAGGAAGFEVSVKISLLELSADGW